MNNMFDIAGKVTVVTGGSGVLGSNIAEGLLKAGAKVIGTSESCEPGCSRYCM